MTTHLRDDVVYCVGCTDDPDDELARTEADIVDLEYDEGWCWACYYDMGPDDREFEFRVIHEQPGRRDEK